MSKTSSEVKNRWNAEHYDRITVLLPKGYKDKLKEAAGSGGVTAWVKAAIDEKLKK